MVGFPGSGKSTLAKKIATHFDAHYFSSDEIREKLFGTTRFDKIGDQIVQAQSKQAYEYMYQQAQQLLQQEQRVVLDATHLDVQKRQTVAQQLLEAVSPEHLCYVLVNPLKEKIEQQMAALGEEIYQDWQRVYGLFAQKELDGAVAWPDQSEGIEQFTHEDVYAKLD